MIIDKALETYNTIHGLMLEIERLVPKQDAARLLEKHAQLQELQTTAQEIDTKLLDLLQADSQPRDGRISGLLDRMQEIQEINRRITPQIQGIMAVQRSEMKKLRAGNTIARGYHSHTGRTGRLISSSG